MTLDDGRFCSIQYLATRGHYTPPNEPNFYGEIEILKISELTCDGELPIDFDGFTGN